MKAEPLFLTFEEVIEIHDYQIEYFGGTDGLRSADLLKSAIGMPSSTFSGNYLHPTFRQKEAGQGIVKTIREPVLIWFRSTWGLDGESHYSYSLDGESFKPFGRPYRLEWGNYRGDRIGIYTFNDDADAGFVSINYFHYR